MTFADLITPAGIVGAAALIVTLTQIVKAALPIVGERVSGALLAFIGTGGLYAVAAFVLPSAGPDALLQVFASWVAVTAGAIGIKSGGEHVNDVIAGPTF